MTTNTNAITMPGERLLNPMQELLEGKKVLLVGTNEVDEMLLRFMVESNDGHLETEDETKSALNKIEHGNFDLILMNTRLNKLNALNLVKTIRQNTNKHIPIIGLTSKDLNGRGLFSGFDYILRRPVEKSKFHRALDTVFTK